MKRAKFWVYTLDLYVRRTGEWLGFETIIATNAKEAKRQARERRFGQNAKAVVSIRTEAAR